MKITVRQVETPRDSVDIEDVATHASNEHGCGREFDPRAIGRHVFYAVKDPERKHINGWVAYDIDGKPVGYLVATMRESMYSFRSYAIQEMWYVLPHARKSFAGLMLLHAFDKWATERNAERIYMQVEHDQDDKLIERVFRLMESMGYRKQGYIGVKVLDGNKEKDTSHDRTAHRAVGAEQAQH
jgi:transposase InsO family protein